MKPVWLVLTVLTSWLMLGACASPAAVAPPGVRLVLAPEAPLAGSKAEAASPETSSASMPGGLSEPDLGPLEGLATPVPAEVQAHGAAWAKAHPEAAQALQALALEFSSGGAAPELSQVLAKAQGLMAEHPEWFQPSPEEEEALAAQLAASEAEREAFNQANTPSPEELAQRQAELQRIVRQACRDGDPVWQGADCESLTVPTGE